MENVLYRTLTSQLTGQVKTKILAKASMTETRRGFLSLALDVYNIVLSFHKPFKPMFVCLFFFCTIRTNFFFRETGEKNQTLLNFNTNLFCRVLQCLVCYATSAHVD